MRTSLIGLALISAVVLISPASASAATDAGVKPGSFWYGFDIAFEKINLFFMFNSESKARKALQYADERLAEAEAVAESKNAEAVKTAINNYENNIAFAAGQSRDVSEKEKAEALLATISDSTSRHQEILAVVLTKVPDEAKEAIKNAIEVSRKGHEEALQKIAELRGEVEQLKKEVEELKKKDEERQAAEIERLKKEVEELKKKPSPAIQSPVQTPVPVQQAPTQTQIPIPTPSPTLPPSIIQQPIPSYSYSVETAVVDYKDAAAIQATVIGNKGALNVILSGPNKSTVETEYISDNDMLDGSETKWLHLQRYAKSNPVSGTYTLIVKEFSGKEVFRKEFNIQGPKPTIVGHTLKWKHGPYSVSTTYEVETLGFYITVRNDGDLTLYLRDADVLLNNTHLYVLGTSLGKYKILSGETVTISVGSSSVTAGSSFYDEGTYPMVINLRGQVDGELKTLTTYTTSVSIP